jgi:hypothetical protein
MEGRWIDFASEPPSSAVRSLIYIKTPPNIAVDKQIDILEDTHMLIHRPPSLTGESVLLHPPLVV